MSDDLIRRLRMLCDTPLGPATNALYAEAADRIEELTEANEAFGKRQVWLTERMFAMEQAREADAALLRQALAQMEDNFYAVANNAPIDDVGAFSGAIAAIRARLGETT